jgi:NADP-dependent 3-hydroxy acid dehydrogenase YdfG
MDPRGETVIVTGASAGIGKALARAFVAAGANVVLASRNIQALNSLANELGQEQTLVVPTDVTQRDQVDALVDRTVERFGRLDVLVNNAGVGVLSSVADLDPMSSSDCSKSISWVRFTGCRLLFGPCARPVAERS